MANLIRRLLAALCALLALLCLGVSALFYLPTQIFLAGAVWLTRRAADLGADVSPETLERVERAERACLRK